MNRAAGLRPMRFSYLLPGLGALVALAISLYLHLDWQRQDERRYAQQVARSAAALQRGLLDYEAGLHQVRDLFLLDREATPRQFEQLVRALRNRRPEVVGVSWVAVPDPAALERRLAGVAGAAGAAPVAPLTYAEPLHSPQLAGADLTVELGGALAAALERGLIAMPPFRYPAAPGEPVCLSLVMPVFDALAPPPGEALQRLRGFAILTLAVEPLLRRTLEPLLGNSRLDLVAASDLTGVPMNFTPVVELLRHPAGAWQFEAGRAVELTLRGSGRHWLLRAQPLASPGWFSLPWQLLAAACVLLALLALHLRWRHLAIADLARLVGQRSAELASARDALTRLADTDPLTGIANRGRFDEELARNWRRAQRNRESIGLLLIDVDHFRELNDGGGHAHGDAVLKEIATALTRCAERPGDLVARYGGGEFALLLPGSASGIEAVAQRCRQAVIDLLIPHPHSTTAGVVTISVGGASLVPGAGSQPGALLENAGVALHRAKRAGRNRVEVVSDA